MRRRLLTLLLAVTSCAGLAQSTFSIGPDDVATGTIPTMESTHAYLLDLPGGVERLTVEVDGGDQDADLAVYLAGEELFYDASGDTSTTYVVADPPAGRYRIEVLNLLFQELSYSLAVSTRSADASAGPAASSPDMGEIAVGDERTGVAPASGSRQSYDLRVPAGSAGFTVRVDAGGRDVDLTVRFGDVEIFRDVSSNPFPLFRLPEPAAGRYVLSVGSPLGRDVPYVVTVETLGRSTAGPPPASDAPSDTPSNTPSDTPPSATPPSGPSGPPAPAWRHDFASGEILGWTVENGSLSNPGRGGPGGGGYLYADTPADRAVGYFVAPPDLLGDWTSLSSLEIVLRHGPEYDGSTFGPYEYDGVGDVLLMNGSMTASFAFPREVSRSWSSYEVPLNDAAGWGLEGGAQSLADVLADVTVFAVRAEYLVGHADAGMASVEAFRGGALGDAGEPQMSATCLTTAEDGVIGDLPPGSRIVVACPGGCTDGGTVWGDGTYTDDSAICRAAIHAGRLEGPYPGTVRVRIVPGLDRYPGEERNGVASRPYGGWPRSFSFEKAPDAR